MEVGGYLYFRFISFYKFNLYQYPPAPASSTSETQYKMAMMRFALLAGPLLSLKDFKLSTLTWWLFFSSPYRTTAWLWRSRSVHVSICAKGFYHSLAKFMGDRYKTPAKDDFFKNKTPSFLTGEVYQVY